MDDYKHIEESPAEELLTPGVEDEQMVPYVQDGRKKIPLHNILNYNEEEDMPVDEAFEELGVPEDAREECRDFLSDQDNIHELARINHVERKQEPSDWAKSMSEDIMREFEASEKDSYSGEIDADNSPVSVIRNSYIDIMESSAEELEINYDREDELHLERDDDTLLESRYDREQEMIHIDSADENTVELRVDAGDREEVRNRITEFYNLLEASQ